MIATMTLEQPPRLEEDLILKSDPICNVPAMLKDSVSTAELQALCHPHQAQNDSEWIAKVMDRTTSRQGRSMQRWKMDEEHGRIRLVTGGIPILSDGRILLVSSNKKQEWILPKGGWEKDERLEESAIREIFEEAGVTGVLGPPLEPIVYETRKARRRRTESTGLDSSYASSDSPSSSVHESNDYTHIEMTLFPIYVTDVKDSWPESGRLRRVLPIDEAIEALSVRPEFQTLLRQVRDKKLNLG